MKLNIVFQFFLKFYSNKHSMYLLGDNIIICKVLGCITCVM